MMSGQIEMNGSERTEGETEINGKHDSVRAAATIYRNREDCLGKKREQINRTRKEENQRCTEFDTTVLPANCYSWWQANWKSSKALLLVASRLKSVQGTTRRSRQTE